MNTCSTLKDSLMWRQAINQMLPEVCGRAGIQKRPGAEKKAVIMPQLGLVCGRQDFVLEEPVSGPSHRI